MSKVYIVQALGWGDDEDEFVNVASYSTRAEAETKVAELTYEWIADAGDTDGLELQIEELALNA